MTTDRELLERAAKAAGLPIVGDVDRMICQPDHKTGGYVIRNDRGGDSCWNPLTDDGDALRLAVKLKFYIQTFMASGFTGAGGFVNMQTELPSASQGRCAATRRAIVRAAACIGESMK